jgi:uncharacterized protein YciI
MKTIFLLVIIILISAQSKAQVINPDYDSTLAKSLGADEYGMKMYTLVILKTGSNQIDDKIKLDSLFRGHMDNINRLAESGQLIVAGPLADNPLSYRGIFILNVAGKAEADKLLETDPTIKEKIFDVEIFGWYGSAALSEYLPVHKKIEKVKF